MEPFSWWVTRDADLFDHIRRQFAGDPASDVIADRLYGERRRRLEPRRPDRRGAERRRPLPGQETPADSPVTLPASPAIPGQGPARRSPRPQVELSATWPGP
jgi:hypothetical protein